MSTAFVISALFSRKRSSNGRRSTVDTRVWPDFVCVDGTPRYPRGGGGGGHKVGVDMQTCRPFETRSKPSILVDIEHNQAV